MFEQIGAFIHKELSRGGSFCDKALEDAFTQFKKLYPLYAEPSRINVAYYQKTPLSMASSSHFEVLEYFLHLESKENSEIKVIYNYAKLSVEQEEDFFYLSLYLIDLKEEFKKESIVYSLSENKILSITKKLKRILRV